MATRSAVMSADEGANRIIITWGASGVYFTGNADVGTGVGLPPGYDWVIQAGGTLGTTPSIGLQGSLDGGTTWGTHPSNAGADILLTTIGKIFALSAAYTPFVRPLATAGDGSTQMFVRMIGTRRLA